MRAVGRVICLLQQVHAHVVHREVVDGQMPRLVHHLHAGGIGHGLAIEYDPHPARAALDDDLVLGPRIGPQDVVFLDLVGSFLNV